jgi:hypothetical protein
MRPDAEELGRCSPLDLGGNKGRKAGKEMSEKSVIFSQGLYVPASPHSNWGRQVSAHFTDEPNEASHHHLSL